MLCHAGMTDKDFILKERLREASAGAALLFLRPLALPQRPYLAMHEGEEEKSIRPLLFLLP